MAYVLGIAIAIAGKSKRGFSWRSIGFVAKEGKMGIVIIVVSVVALLAAYLLYGRWLSKKWGIDPRAKTPAVELEDGMDYVPSSRGVVFGHQFSSIAGAGSISGAIQASIFGWLPVMLWVLIGGIFIGAVQDFATMYTSVKNKGRVIGYIIEEYVGKAGKKMFLLFCWLFCVMLIAAFSDIVAGTLNGFITPKVSEIERVTSNGAAATTTIVFMIEAVAFGFILRFAKLKTWLNTLIAVGMIIVAVSLGLTFPIYIIHEAWHIIVFLYLALATVLPIWVLLQPRDYLNSYLLLAIIIASVIGIFATNPEVNLPAFAGFKVDGNYMFPFVFGTLACGAVSGFHALLSSGTTSKQIRNERDILPVSFGAMLIESLLAIIALVASASLTTAFISEQGLTSPIQLFSGGIASFLTTFGLSYDVAFTFMSLAASAFALTSIDSVARVARLSFQEIFRDGNVSDDELGPVARVLTNRYFATLVTLVPAYLLAKDGWAKIWPLFSSANQLLSVIALLICALFFKKVNKERRVLYVPIFVMIVITLSSLVMRFIEKVNIIAAGEGIQAEIMHLVFALLVMGLGISVAVQGIISLRKKPEEKLVTKEN